MDDGAHPPATLVGGMLRIFLKSLGRWAPREHEGWRLDPGVNDPHLEIYGDDVAVASY